MFHCVIIITASPHQGVVTMSAGSGEGGGVIGLNQYIDTIISGSVASCAAKRRQQRGKSQPCRSD